MMEKLRIAKEPLSQDLANSHILLYFLTIFINTQDYSKHENTLK